MAGSPLKRLRRLGLMSNATAVALLAQRKQLRKIRKQAEADPLLNAVRARERQETCAVWTRLKGHTIAWLDSEAERLSKESGKPITRGYVLRAIVEIAYEEAMRVKPTLQPPTS